MTKTFNDLLHLLMRSSDESTTYGYYWAKQSKITFWWPTNSPAPIPDAREDLYFGVHPSRTKKLRTSRAKEEDIYAINCLYADFDLKTFSGSKEETLKHIEGIPVEPSAIVESGGGYHCYWLLTDPFVLDTVSKREIAKDLQSEWVNHWRGDLAVHDLARLLRIPGTFNHKYNPPREVKILKLLLGLKYDMIELQSSLPSPSKEHRGGGEVGLLSVPEPKQPNNLTEQEIVDLIMKSAEKDKFKALFTGVDEGYESASEADLSFCSILSFWTGGDYDKIDRIFRASKRMRLKWERDDYRHSTLVKAIMNTDKFYVHPGGFLTAGAHDDGNAEVVKHRVVNEICYSEAFGWLRYVDGYWKSELAEPYTEKRITQILKQRRSAAISADEEAIARVCRPDSGKVLRTKTMLRHKVMVSVDQFDVSLDELNCINGAVNLRTGKISPHHPSKMFTYVVPTRYNPGADTSYWESWLKEVLNDNEEVIDYLQLALGYSLSGRIREEIMFYLYGPQRAGKGVFIESIISALGGRPLATEMDIDVFMSQNRSNSSIGFSLAALKAARFVAASESDERQWLNARGIKRWTGGNFITCAHKYGRDFTYRPQFKIWLTSNYEPQMDADDDAAWGRLRVLRFPNSYKGREDKTLKEKMRQPKVAEGILRWCIEGAIKWYAMDEGGLKTPQIVEDKTKEARKSLDWVATWVDEKVHLVGGRENRLPSDEYYPDYSDWCRENGVNPKSLRSLNRSLSKKGYDVSVPAKVDGKTKRCWMGAKLNGFTSGLVRMRQQSKEE